jgi:hypothetical protein
MKRRGYFSFISYEMLKVTQEKFPNVSSRLDALQRNRFKADGMSRR